jgi:membrane protease YdiL (CAAX protease family)
MKTIKKELIWYLLPTFIITYGLGLLSYLKGGSEHFPIGKFSMIVPLLVVLVLYPFVFKKPIFKNNDLGIRFKGLKYWIITPLFITGIVIITYLISSIFEKDFFQSTQDIFQSTQDSGFGVGNWFGNLLVIFGVNALLSPILNIWMMLGEEIGWRAFMTPRLLKLYKPKKAFIIGGTIWALWHAVGIIMGHNYPDYPILGNLLMILMCIPLGVILQYFYFKSRSIFVAAIGHGALNWSARSFGFVLENDNYNTLLYGPTGIVGILFLWLVAYYLIDKIDWVKENTLQIEKS